MMGEPMPEPIDPMGTLPMFKPPKPIPNPSPAARLVVRITDLLAAAWMVQAGAIEDRGTRSYVNVVLDDGTEFAIQVTEHTKVST